MPIQYNYEPASEILTVKLSGQVSLDEMKAAMMQILEDSEIPSDTNAIWDVGDMEFNNITLEFQQELVGLREQINDRRGHAKIAILSSYTLAEPLLKMYTILSKNLSQTTKVFMLEDEAKQWLCSNSQSSTGRS